MLFPVCNAGSTPSGVRTLWSKDVSVTPEMLRDLAQTPALFFSIERDMKQVAAQGLFFIHIQMTDWSSASGKKCESWSSALVEAAIERWAAFRPEVSDGFLTLRWDLPVSG